MSILNKCVTFYSFYENIQNYTKFHQTRNEKVAYFLAVLLSCFLIISSKFSLVTVMSSLLCCFSLRCCSCRYGEFSSWGGNWEPVGFTRFTIWRNSRLWLLLRKVMAVPLWPSLPALPIWKTSSTALLVMQVETIKKIMSCLCISPEVYPLSGLYLMNIFVHVWRHVEVHHKLDIDQV